jgi:hypothetical protein
MRPLLYALLLLISHGSFAQSVLKFVKASSGEPMCGLYPTIYKNGNTFATCGGTNEDGILKVKLSNFDSTATYQATVNLLKYEKIWKEIDLSKSDTVVIEVKDNDYFIPGSKDILSQACSTFSLLDYNPSEPRILADLPENIADSVLTYLKNRVGSDNFSDLKFIGGQIIDFEEYRKHYPNSKRKTAYYLCFSYRNLQAGIAMYSSKIELAENGEILKDIDFPLTDTKINPISLPDIRDKATKEGHFITGTTLIGMAYFSKTNRLVWKLVNDFLYEDNTSLTKHIFYDAQTGEFIREDSFKGSWVN